jgi:hypothetical protein
MSVAESMIWHGVEAVSEFARAARSSKVLSGTNAFSAGKTTAKSANLRK